MLPISEGDRDVRDRVVAITGPCSCSQKYRSRWVGHASDRRDPSCAFHSWGEDFASLIRDVRILKAKVAKLQVCNLAYQIQSGSIVSTTEEIDGTS